MRRDATAKSPLMPAIGVGGTLALLAATLPSLLGGKDRSTRIERVAYLGYSAPGPRRAPSTPPPAARPHVSRLVLGAPAHPAVVGTETLPPESPATVTPASTAPPPSTTTEVASTTPAAPTESTKPTTDARAPVHHAAAATHKPATPATHPAVVAAVARKAAPASHSAAPVTHVASDVHSSHSSGDVSSGGAAPQAPQRTRHRSRPATSTRPATTTHSGASHRSAVSGGAGIRPTHRSTGPVSTGGYVNPFARASVSPERIDQGVDYGGSGPLEALGDGRVTYVGTSGTGWPGAFIEWRLSDGPDAGRYVYYAEGIVPAQGLHVGQRIRAGQVIATMTSGIEVGWGAGIGTESYAMQQGQWQSGMDSGNVATPAGKDFSALIAALGGPPGKVEG
jgi:hypothetical protein